MQEQDVEYFNKISQMQDIQLPPEELNKDLTEFRRDSGVTPNLVDVL